MKTTELTPLEGIREQLAAALTLTRILGLSADARRNFLMQFVDETIADLEEIAEMPAPAPAPVEVKVKPILFTDVAKPAGHPMKPRLFSDVLDGPTDVDQEMRSPQNLASPI